MRKLRLENCVGWGNEIHIETDVCTYAGSGRGYGEKTGGRITRVLPDAKEFLDDDGFARKIKVSGFKSPRPRVGDTLSYEFNASTNSRFELLITDIEYMRDPSDMFFGRAILIKSDGKEVPRRTIINRMLKRLNLLARS